MVKNEKEGKQREKKRKREQEDRRSNTARSHYVPKPECMKKADENIKKLCGTGDFRCENYTTRKLQLTT